MTQGHNIIKAGDEPSKGLDEVNTSLTKEQAKSLFYLYAGKPDSRIKVYHKPLFLEVSDITELNDCITRKLQTHNIDAQITSLNIGYEGSDIQEFGSWAEFKDHHWQVPECIEEIVIKWDFLVAINGYLAPQRHTLLVRISFDMKPGKFMQMLISGNSDEFDQIDVMTAPAFCRVDFINAQISKELINEVTDWIDGRKEPALITDFYYWFKNKRQKIAEITHHSIMFMYAMLWIASFLWANTNIYKNNISIEIIAIWLFIGLYGFTPIGRFGHIFASKIYRALDKINGKKVVFNFTSGDKKANSEIENKNKQHGKLFLKQTSWSILINVFSGLLATYLYMNS